MHTSLLSALFAVLVYAQPDAVEKRIRVEGRVTTLNGEPASALVRLQALPDPSTRGKRPPVYSRNTDANGNFAFGDVTPGTYTLTSYKEGYIPHPYGARSDTSPAAELVLAAGTELEELLLQMTPLAVVSGRVTDRDGRGVGDISVEVYRSGPSGRTGGLGKTDDQGNYRVSKLPPGSYYVKASPSRSTNLVQDRAAGEQQSASVVTFYPGAPDMKAAATVNLEAGGEARGVDVQMRQVPVYSIRGRVMDRSTGTPAPARVAAIPPGSRVVALISARSATTGADGSFEIRGLVPGTYMLLGSAAGNFTSADSSPLAFLNHAAAGTGSGRFRVTVSGSDVNNVVLELNAGATVTGKIRMEDGDLKDWLPEPPRIEVVSNEGILAGSASAAYGEDGTFLLQDVSLSKYFITVGGLSDGVYVKSIMRDGQDETRSPVDLTSGGGGSLEIVLSAKAADLGGTVRNDKGAPIPDIPVTLWPKIPDRSNMTNGIKTVKTNRTGAFGIFNLAPGDYFVAAWEYPEVGLAENPSFLARFASDEFTVKLEESGHLNVDIKLVPHNRIAAEAAKLP